MNAAVTNLDLAMKTALASRLLGEITRDAGSRRAMQIVLKVVGDSLQPPDRGTLDAMSQMTTEELTSLMTPCDFEIDPRDSVSLKEMTKECLKAETATDRSAPR